jgi:hypothetical protein
MTPARKTMTIIITAVFIAVMGYALLLNWAVPKMAAFSIPAKWKMLPIKQTKPLFREFLGHPAFTETGRDEWRSGSASKTYRLSIHYFADSVASSYAVYYRYEKGWIKKEFLLDSFSVR